MLMEIARVVSSSFKFLTDRVWRIVHNWDDQPMSQARKEALLKSVTQAISNYIMSCFCVPVAICEKIRQIIADYW
jgi:hypothetical protein